MAGSKSDYLENALLDHVLGGATLSQLPTVYFAAYTVAPTDAGGGTEVTGGSYARVAKTNDTTVWSAASGGLKTNGGASGAVTFPQATANWGTVVAIGIFSALTSGNLLYWGTLTASKTIDSGDQLVLAAGDVDITED